MDIAPAIVILPYRNYSKNKTKQNNKCDVYVTIRIKTPITNFQKIFFK